ncbi:MAG TPA: hypothetical protein VHU84_10755 [Lacipirellulaceae bacterium]|nr:hypothetical protein [Lacipirellulaceae bacterium]
MRSHRLTRLPLLAAACLLTYAAFGIATSARAAFIDLTPTSGVNSSNSVPLSDLISGAVDGVTVGDKQFSGFNYSFIGDMPQAINVQVLGFKDTDGNWGVSFHGAFLDLPGGSISDAAIRFVVDIDPAALAAGNRISDAHLFMNGSGVGADSFFTVDESFLENSKTLNAFVSTLNGGGTQMSDSTVFDQPLTQLHVTKDILAMASNGTFLPARATVIDQSFSQIKVPEPAAVLMSLIGSVALVGFGRKRNR